ncbi:MAG: phosphate ABC transporter permease PstA [Fibrella sp.]|nr:phosphate ABC transporter permease PstA [Armatimonadota bacterium]
MSTPATTLLRSANTTSRQNYEKLMFGVMGLGAVCVVIPMVYIFVTLFIGGIGKVLTPGFLTEIPSRGSTQGGIGPQIGGTIALMIGTIVLALPLGISAAIYLTEYAGKNALTRAIRMAIVNLAGVPSIVHGLFGLGLFVYLLGAWMDKISGFSSLDPPQNFWGRPTLLWGAATLAILVLPIVITATEESLKTVPRSFREGSIGLGATKWQTIWKVVLPAALPGILTGTILAIGRAAGETAPIILVAAVGYKTNFAPIPPLYEPVVALPYHLFYVVTEVARATPALQYGTALTLLLIVFGMNLVAIILRTRLRNARRW